MLMWTKTETQRGNKPMKRIVIALLLMFACCTAFTAEKPERTPAEQQAVAANRKKARARMQEDDKRYTNQEIREIEALYQTWNTLKGNEQKAVAQKLIRRYPKANRTGCILVYLADVSSRYEEIKLLKQAIKEYDDCFFGDGTQVGAIARFRLAKALIRINKKEEAAKLFDELRTSYPDATIFDGRLFVNILDEANEK